MEAPTRVDEARKLYLDLCSDQSALPPGISASQSKRTQTWWLLDHVERLAYKDPAEFVLDRSLRLKAGVEHVQEGTWTARPVEE